MTDDAAAFRREESREERHARWIAAIEEAHENYIFDPRVDRSKYDELEDRLLRQLGFRMPLTISVNNFEAISNADGAHRERRQEMEMLVSYAAFLFKEPTFAEKFRRFHNGDTSIDFNRETWSAAQRLSRKIGGECSPEHIRLALGKIKSQHEAAVGRPSAIPFPIGDSPL